MKPSLAQMFCRSNMDHASVLRATERGEQLMHVTRAHLTAARTLSRWGAIDKGGITAIGRELLAKYRAAGWASAGRTGDGGPNNDNDDTSVEYDAVSPWVWS